MYNLYIEEKKKKDIENKKTEILNCLDYSYNNISQLTLNFSSCYFLNSFPPTYAGTTAKEINNWFIEQIETKDRNNLGIVVSDFVTSDFAQAIYRRNEK